MIQKMNYKYIFGPVPSRRLGVSAGIDLVTPKTCTLDCVYCECGRTTNFTLSRKEYVPTDEVIAELDDYLSSSPELDYLTFSGSGEPTLHSDIHKIINFIKENYPQYRTALLTNGTLFYRDELIEEVSQIDLIIPSLDAVSEEVFQKINRPCNNLKSDRIIEGLIKLRQNYHGQIWLEIFIIPGLNDTDSELKLFKDTIHRIKPDRIQLNTLDRPGTEAWVQPASQEKINKIASYLGKGTEAVVNFRSRKQVKSFNKNTKENILETLKRRPCTDSDLSYILGLHKNEINKYIQVLLENDKIESKHEERGNFYYVDN